jgi:hypothetical protein
MPSGGGGFPTYYGSATNLNQTNGPSNRFTTFSWTSVAMTVDLALGIAIGPFNGVVFSGGGLQVQNAGVYNVRIRGLVSLGNISNSMEGGTNVAAAGTMSTMVAVNGVTVARSRVVANAPNLSSRDAGNVLLSFDGVLSLAANDIVKARWDGASLGNFGGAGAYSAEIHIESRF